MWEDNICKLSMLFERGSLTSISAISDITLFRKCPMAHHAVWTWPIFIWEFKFTFYRELISIFVTLFSQRFCPVKKKACEVSFYVASLGGHYGLLRGCASGKEAGKAGVCRAHRHQFSNCSRQNGRARAAVDVAPVFIALSIPVWSSFMIFLPLEFWNDFLKKVTMQPRGAVSGPLCAGPCIGCHQRWGRYGDVSPNTEHHHLELVHLWFWYRYCTLPPVPCLDTTAPRECGNRERGRKGRQVLILQTVLPSYDNY